MRSYTVHRKRRTIGKPLAEAEATVFVRDGFSWPALFLPFLWALYHRLWLVLLGFVVVFLGLNLLIVSAGFPGAVNAIISAAIQFLFAAEAAELRRWTLTRRRYDIVAVILAPSRDEAETRYFRDWTASIEAHQKTRAARDDVQIAFRAHADEPGTGLVPGDKPA